MTTTKAPLPNEVETVTLFQCKIVEKNCDHEWVPEDENPEYCAKCGTSLMAYAMMECF